MRKIHYISGLTIALFIALHLFNHVSSIWGAHKHIEIMGHLRVIYRNSVVESMLFIAVAIQIFSGLKLFKKKIKGTTSHFDKLQLWTGLYLAIFLAVHLAAVLVGRLFLNLDTNFYFGVAGLNSFPANLFFIPYYGFAIISFFGHIAAMHNRKMKLKIFNLTPAKQSKAIFALGFCLTMLILYGLTNHFKGVNLPIEYNVLIGK